MRPHRELSAEASERGAVLILALVFLLAIGLVTIATASMAVNANANTSNAHTQLVTQANLESEASLAIQATRIPPGNSYNYAGCSSNCYATSGFSSASNCTPSAGAISGLTVYCEGSGGNGSSPTRTVDFYVCKSGNACPGNPALFAEVIYQDLPAGEPQTADQCTTTSTVTCGLTMTVASWDVRLADS